MKITPEKYKPEMLAGETVPQNYILFSWAEALVEEGYNAVIVGRSLLDPEDVLVWIDHKMLTMPIQKYYDWTRDK